MHSTKLDILVRIRFQKLSIEAAMENIKPVNLTESEFGYQQIPLITALLAFLA